MRGQSPLDLLDLPLQLVHDPEVLGNSFLLVDLDGVVNDVVFKVLATKMGITHGGQDLKDAITDGKKGDIESSTTEIVDDDLRFLALLVKTVGDGSSGRLVDNTKDMKAGNGTGILGSLTLSVVGVGGDGNDGMGDLLAGVSFSGLLHLGQDHSENLFRSEIPLVTMVLDRNSGLSVILDNLERPMHIVNQTLNHGDDRETYTYKCFWSRLTSGSSILRPIKRLALKTVFSGLVWMSFLAVSPTLRKRVSCQKRNSVKEIHEGVIR